MLYVTTRSKRDAFTAHKVLRENIAPDDGLYLPMRFPEYDSDKIHELSTLGFSASVAEILNAFFSCNLNGWDVEFCIGRKAAKLITMNHRITVAELWHNAGISYKNLVKDLYNNIIASDNATVPTEWFSFAVRIAVLFGVYSEMCKQNIICCGDHIDVSVFADDFSTPIAIDYAKYMGLPISTIVCTCNNSFIWDFVHLGELAVTNVGNSILSGFERLICNRLSQLDVDYFLNATKCNRTIIFNEEKLNILNRGYYCIVVSESRAAQAINSIFRNTQYIANPECAISIAGLQDYRAKTGESNPTVVFSDFSPLDYKNEIECATGIPAIKLHEYVNI